ncbi:MAG TPA: AsmA-like C-terminal domain-containing protein, partial [Stellaceae bacterium]|nr:AsmA-like C-terminal domain-containing protein [Stellaceae bacterium]
QSIRLDLAPFGSGAIRLRFGETGGARPFDFSTTDLGATLRLLDVSDHVTGGTLSATGQAQDVGPVRVFNGRLDGADYKIVGAPVMAKLLSVASFTSIASLLSGEGIPFTRLTGDFTAQDGKVTVKQGRAYGGALGINATGTVDLGQSTLDLEGTLVPAYMLNNILSNIPLIGNFLIGGEGQGLFAAAFHVRGPLDDPTISVNPLSALAPGALRNLFLFEPGSPEGAQPSRRESN